MKVTQRMNWWGMGEAEATVEGNGFNQEALGENFGLDKCGLEI